MPVIQAHQTIAGPEAVMVLGDSNTEQAGWWNEIAGCRVVNAGFGGIATMDLAERMKALPGSPRFVFLMIGTNTSGEKKTDDEVKKYPAHLWGIVDSLQKRGTRVILVSIPPVSKQAAQKYLKPRIDYMNGIAYAVALNLGLQFVNLNYALMDLNTNSPTYGYAHPWAMQADGVHLTRQAHVLLHEAQEKALQVEMGRSGIDCLH